MFGCSSKSTLDTSGDDTASAISISATPTSVSTNETSVVEARITAGGAGVANQVVFFSVTPASAGTITPAYDTTAADGVAATVFTASQAGAVVVQAQVVGTGLTQTVGLSVSEEEIEGSGNITLSASRSLLLANGVDTSVMTIVVRDELGQPAPDGTLIKITAGEKFVDIDGNGYWSPNIDSLVFDANNNGAWDSFGLIPSNATTSGGTGQVQVNYIAGVEAYTVYVKATVDDGGIVGYAELTLQLSPNTVLYSIYLSSDSVSLSVTETGGIETATLRAAGFDTHGNPVPEGMAIVFAILDGPGGGEHIDTLGYGPDTVYTNGQGVATTTISSGTISGTVRIRAFAGTVLSNATQVLIAAGPPQYIVVGTSSLNVPYWNTVGDTVGVLAVVSDVYLNPVNDSTVVYFTTDEATIMSHHVRTESGRGIATSTWISGNNVGTADGDVWVYAETSGGTVSDSSMFINSGASVTLFLTDWQPTLLADGEDKFIATIHGRDINDNFLVDGYPFEAEASYLTVTSGAFKDGWNSSSDHVTVTSTTLSRDASLTGGNDDGIGAVDLVTYYTGTASVTGTVQLLTGDSYGGNSQVNGPSTAQPGEQIRLSAVIADRWGNPLGDHTLNMTAADGVVTGGTQETNGYGEASNFIWTAPALDGDYNINVTDTDPRGAGLVITKKITVKAAT
jgi:adhesin/invasin